MTPGQMLDTALAQGATPDLVGWVDGVLTILLSASAVDAPNVAAAISLTGAAPEWQTTTPTLLVMLSEES